MTLPIRATAVIIGLLFVTPLVQAWTKESSAYDDCPTLSDLCSVSLRHELWFSTDPYYLYWECDGTYGSYTSCDVEHECRATVTGVTPTGVLACGAGSDTCTGTTECSMRAFERVNILTGGCYYFTASAWVITPAGSATATAPTLRACVNAWGAY